MGYTHYFSVVNVDKYKEVYEQLISDTNIIIELADIPLEGYTPENKDQEGSQKISKPDSGIFMDENGDSTGSISITDPAGDETTKRSTKLPVNLDANLQGTACASVKYGIYLNGIGSDGHETFVLAHPNPTTVEDNSWCIGGKPGEINGFCKTARKPYDLVVCAVLCRAKMLMGDGFEFSSDGVWNFDKEWIQARDFYCQVFPDDASELTAEKMGMADWSDEEIKEHESEYGPGFDERWIGAIFTKEALGPIAAMLNAHMRGEAVTEEQLNWLQSPLPPPNPNRLPEGDIKNREG